MIGMIVMLAAQYLGYATTGRKLYLQLASAALANISKVAVA
jgi:chromatin segregation and condensation protein Rec8/ScpA/Scc1 (kleisin family)